MAVASASIGNHVDKVKAAEEQSVDPNDTPVKGLVTVSDVWCDKFNAGCVSFKARIPYDKSNSDKKCHLWYIFW